MGAPDRTLSSALALALGLSLGCAGDGAQSFDPNRPTQAKAEIEQTKQAAQDDPGAAPALPNPPAAPDTAAEAAPGTEPVLDPTEPVVAKPGVVHFKTATLEEPEPAEPSLFEASQAERRRRENSAPAQIVITDANLGDFSDVGQLSELAGQEPPQSAASAAAASPQEADPETYWRSLVRDARLAWRAAADRITELEERVAELRLEFYSEDDPHHRDAVTKPAWDRAAIDLDRAYLRVEETRSQLDRVLEEGYAAGALAGWLREGIEFEPVENRGEQREGDLESATSIEPPIAEEPPR